MTEEIQFSIYKISPELVIKNNNNIDSNTNIEDMLDILLDNIFKGTNKPPKDKAVLFAKDGYKGVLIKKKRNPAWEGLIGNLMGVTKPESKELIINESVSFILFKIVNNELYATTGGYGSSYLDKIKEKGYGKDLTPKITQNTDMIIKGITEYNISGDDVATKKTKKGISSVAQESESTKIPSEFSLTVDPPFLSVFGLDIEDNKRISIDNGDSIKIRKKISLEDLTTVLECLNQIEKKPDNYQLGYLIPIKRRYKKSDLDNELWSAMISQKRYAEIFPETSDDYLKNSKDYVIEYSNEEISKDSPITIEDLWELLSKVTKREPSKNSLREIVTKGSVKAIDENLHPTLHKSIYDCLKCSLEYDEKTFYLLNGQWYMYDVNKYQIIKDNYVSLFKENKKKLGELNLINKYGLLKNTASNEDKYNKSFKECNNIIVTHPKKLKLVEPCDLIFWDEDRLYLMCNKSYMDGTGVRDLEGQISTSASIIEGILLDEKNKELLKDYYNKLETEEIDKITEEEFCNLFNKRITYIAGFSENFTAKTTSVYCQALLYELSVELRKKEFDLIIMNYKKETK